MNMLAASSISVTFAALTGCGGTEQYLRSEPATHFATATSLTLSDDVGKYLQLHCIKASKIKYSDKNGKSSECLYVSADASAFPAATLEPTVRNKIVHTLLAVSDMNCSTFLHRAFANREGMDYSKTLLQDFATAVSAGTAAVSAPLSAGLSGANLVVGKSVDTLTATYYMQQTFQAMETAIDGARKDTRALIAAHEAQDEETYSPAEALADIRRYDDDCSIKGGLAKLALAAQASQKSSVATQAAVATADTPSAKLQAYVKSSALQ